MLLELQQLLLRLLLLGWLTGGAWTLPGESNPLEQMAMGALNAGSQIMSTLQDGQMAQKQINFDTPLMAVHSKKTIGFGDAMRKSENDDSDSSESDERRRRRRRRRRSPCWNKMMGATTEAAEDDEVEARRKRAQKRAANNNASRSRIVKKKKTKKLHRRRRRRQTNPDGATLQQQGASLGASLGERVKGMWLLFVDNVVDVVQQMRQQIRGAATKATGNN